LYAILFRQIARTTGRGEYVHIADRCLHRYVDHQKEDGCFEAKINAGGMQTPSPAGLGPWVFFWLYLFDRQEKALPEKKAPVRKRTVVWPDISSMIIRENGMELSATLLGGYSPLLELRWKGLNLSAAGPEVGGGENYLHFGIHTKRKKWDRNNELRDHYNDGRIGILRGCVSTMDIDREMVIMTKVESPPTKVDIMLQIAILYCENNLLLATRADGETEKGYQFAFLFENSPLKHPIRIKVQGEKEIVPPHEVQAEKCEHLPVVPLSIEGERQVRLVLVPIRTPAQRIAIEQVQKTSKKARYRNDVRVLLQGEDMRGESTFLLRGGNTGEGNIDTVIDFFSRLNLFCENLEELVRAMTDRIGPGGDFHARDTETSRQCQASRRAG